MLPCGPKIKPSCRLVPCILILLFWPRLPAAQAPASAKVGVATVEKRRLQSELVLLGQAEAVRTSRPSAEVEGLVDEVLVDDGDAVEAGQPLLRLDVGLREIAKRRAEAELRLAEEQLAEYREGSRPEEIRQAEEAMNSAKFIEEEARRDLARTRSLWEKGAASDQEHTAAQAKAQAASALYREKVAACELVKAGPRSEVVVRAEMQVAVRKAELDQLVDEIRRAEVRAPYAGRITRKLVERGDYVQRGAAVFSMVQLRPIRVVMAAPERVVDRLRKGTRLSITFDSLPGEEFETEVETVIPVADSTARTFPVRTSLANDDGRLLTGMAARGRVSLPAAAPLLAVPSDAIVRTETALLVYAVREGVAAAVPVRPGITDGDWTAVVGDLEEGEQVVVRGNERLFPGAPVEILGEGAPSATTEETRP